MYLEYYSFTYSCLPDWTKAIMFKYPTTRYLNSPQNTIKFDNIYNAMWNNLSCF